MNLNLGCGPGPVLDSRYTYLDASRKLLLSKLGLPSFILNHFSQESTAWDRKVKYKNILKLRLPAESVNFVYSSHLLEHLYFNEAVNLVTIIFRSQKSNGRIRLALPDYDLFIREFADTFEENPAIANENFERRLLSHPLARPSLFRKIRNLIVGDFHIHKWHPNFAITERILVEAGYVDVRRLNFRQSALLGIENIEFRDLNTFYIEARKK